MQIVSFMLEPREVCPIAAGQMEGNYIDLLASSKSSLCDANMIASILHQLSRKYDTSTGAKFRNNSHEIRCPLEKRYPTSNTKFGDAKTFQL